MSSQTEAPNPRSYFLTTRRLGFDSWSHRDLSLAVSLWGDAKVTALIGGPFDEPDIRIRLEREIENLAMHGVQYWPVFLLEGHRFAGCAGLRPYRVENRIYELGFHLCPEFWGRGLASEAGAAVVQYGFVVLGAHALFAGHHPENTASRRVLQRLGFRFTHQEFYPPTGLNHPSYLLERT